MVAGCGSSNDTSASSSGSSKTTSNAQATGTPLRIGVLVNASGANTNGQDKAPAVLQAWAKAVNTDGGIAGHPVEFAIKDTKGDAPTATSAAQSLAGDNSVLGAILFDAETEAVAAPKLAQGKLPVIGGMGYIPTAWGKLPNWLPLTTSFPAVINMGMVMGKEVGGRTTIFPICAENPSCGAAEPLAKSAAAGLGLKFAGQLKVAASTPDLTAQCLQIKNKGVDYVAIALQTSTAMRLISACKTQGYTGRWGIWNGSVLPEVIKKNDAGVPIEIGLTSFPWFTDDAPVKAYRNMMNNQGVPETTWADAHSTAAYATAELFKKAVSSAAPGSAKTMTRAGLLQAYAGVRNETLGGLLPQPVTFTPDKPQPLVTCFWLAKFENGQFSGATLGRPVCDPSALEKG
jgi:branched-chain amino acid transport system substrate-binding protein